MWVASTLSRAGLIKSEKHGWVFYGFCMVRKAPELMEMGTREATQGELQDDLENLSSSVTCGSVNIQGMYENWLHITYVPITSPPRMKGFVQN